LNTEGSHIGYSKIPDKVSGGDSPLLKKRAFFCSKPTGISRKNHGISKKTYRFSPFDIFLTAKMFIINKLIFKMIFLFFTCAD